MPNFLGWVADHIFLLMVLCCVSPFFPQGNLIPTNWLLLLIFYFGVHLLEYSNQGYNNSIFLEFVHVLWAFTLITTLSLTLSFTPSCRPNDKMKGEKTSRSFSHLVTEGTETSVDRVNNLSKQQSSFCVGDSG